jgi:hypothetical protein
MVKEEKNYMACRESRAEQSRAEYIKIHKKAFTISINKHTTYFDMERAINFWVSTTRT